MISSFYFGQYRYKESFIHSLDPRLKLAFVVSLSILLFSIKNTKQVAVFSAFAFILILLARADLSSFVKSIRPFYFIFVFLLMMYMLFARDKIYEGLLSIYRFFMLIALSFLLTYTTRISEMVVSIEKLSKPLKLFGIKPRNIAVMVSIAIRFIPVMFISMEKTRDAMLARLANFRKLKNIRQLMIVLLERMFMSASNLSDAMQARLYSENMENKSKMPLKWQDYLSVAAIISLFYLI